ncbi:MAG TPA: hypothetical protein VGQ83_42140 [Polyangia bacterium]
MRTPVQSLMLQIEVLLRHAAGDAATGQGSAFSFTVPAGDPPST